MNTTETAPATPDSAHKKSDGKLPVIEIFGPTIQGEGAMIGVKTHFIRLGGCDFRCRMCDSLHAVIPEAVKKNATWMLPDQIVQKLLELDLDGMAEYVTLSGGNPAMWDCTELVKGLQEAGFKVALETQGSLWQDWINWCDHVTISPKGPGMGEKFNDRDFISFINQLRPDVSMCTKIVVFDQRDFEFACAVSEILDKGNYELLCDRYLSLGNSYPPILKPDMQLEAAFVQDQSGSPVHNFPKQLLQDYKSLLDDYLKDDRLRKWKFLPQLHVLIYGNQSEV